MALAGQDALGGRDRSLRLALRCPDRVVADRRYGRLRLTGAGAGAGLGRDDGRRDRTPS
ncbi:hypothetical protein GTW66_16130 [Streptomyces sp. SID5473]|uniref:hypothetical protein n=1 Tax=Streptomyces sp. SID5473 TaxID=2690299 RepID=UPI00131ECB12|nr:hypothetical protein [Streptomyces sp. SID5473]MYS65518.1 hypothetical protein [Streptomyces sp. SID5473]